MRLRKRAASFGFFAAGAFALAGVGASGLSSGCFPAAGEGVDPPGLSFYFPVGLAVSRGGNVLYAVNSDFDLQWNGGTIQSLDLHLMRRHAVMAIADPTDPQLPLAIPVDPDASCPAGPPVLSTLNDAGIEPGWACAPPTNASYYMRDSVVIGAFATDLQLSLKPKPDDATRSRLFAPVRGDASLTWADVADDDPSVPPTATDTRRHVSGLQARLRRARRAQPLRLAPPHRQRHQPAGRHARRHDARRAVRHGAVGRRRASDRHHAPVATSTRSLFSAFTPGAQGRSRLQFVLERRADGRHRHRVHPARRARLPGVLPADEPPSDACNAVPPATGVPADEPRGRPGRAHPFLRDIGTGPSSLFRPFISDETNYNAQRDAGTTDFARGIAIDPSPRIRCVATITVPDTTRRSRRSRRTAPQIPGARVHREPRARVAPRGERRSSPSRRRAPTTRTTRRSRRRFRCRPGRRP